MNRPKQSLRKAINDHCKSCGYDDKSGLGTWRKQIEDCPCTHCCLYPVRPVTVAKTRNTQTAADSSIDNEVVVR